MLEPMRMRTPNKHCNAFIRMIILIKHVSAQITAFIALHLHWVNTFTCLQHSSWGVCFSFSLRHSLLISSPVQWEKNSSSLISFYFDFFLFFFGFGIFAIYYFHSKNRMHFTSVSDSSVLRNTMFVFIIFRLNIITIFLSSSVHLHIETVSHAICRMKTGWCFNVGVWLYLVSRNHSENDRVHVLLCVIYDIYVSLALSSWPQWTVCVLDRCAANTHSLQEFIICC